MESMYKVFCVCSEGKLHWNTNLQIQIDVARRQRTQRAFRRPAEAQAGLSGFYQGGSEIFGCLCPVLPLPLTLLSLCVCVCWKFENYVTAFGKERRKNCWNVEIGLELSWILNDERAAKGSGQQQSEEEEE